MTRIFALSLLLVHLFASVVRAEDKDCVDPTTLKNSAVSLTWYFTPEEKGNRDFYGIAGTAWFFRSTRYLVTAQHVVRNPDMPLNEWREVELGTEDSDGKLKIEKVQARLSTILPGIPEGFAIFELQEPFSGGLPLTLRETPLRKGDTVFSVVYLKGKLRYAKGSFFQLTDESYLNPQVKPGSALFEFFDIDQRKNDRYVTDHSTSGAAIIDCNGEVAAVLQIFLERVTMVFAGKEIRVTSAWGEPNNTGSLVTPLFAFKPQK